MISTSNNGQISEEHIKQYSGGTLIGVCSFLLALLTILVGLRFFARHTAGLSWGYDDAIIPLAWLSNVGLNAAAINGVYNAEVGEQLVSMSQSDPSKIAAWAKSLLAVEMLYITAAALPKFSIVLLFLRIFTSRTARWTCYALLVYTGAVWIAYTVTTMLQCIPLAYLWDKTIPGGHCVNISVYYKTTSVPNLFSDLIIAVIPIPTIARLHTSLRHKLGLALVFLAGSLGTIGSCVRMSMFFRKNILVDNTWSSVPLIAWTCVEPGMYLAATCLVALRPLLNKIRFKKTPPSPSRRPDAAPVSYKIHHFTIQIPARVEGTPSQLRG